MKSNKKLLDFYSHLYQLERYASICRFDYDAIDDYDNVNDEIVIGIGQLVVQIDCYEFIRADGNHKIAVMHLDAVREKMSNYPDQFNIWEHFQSIFGGAEHEIKIMFNFDFPMHRRIYREIINNLLEPSV
ncbi:hypothetical protein [Parasutterella muris]|uniref:hypothetical protein n=1 Tax=Parasutterella muris TaxID=2565572 RepID=UPI002040E3DC|nr:hypothetical protein [Parasutterella muris]